MAKVQKFANDEMLTDLQTLIRQPSVSARKQGLRECANLVQRIMSKSGIKTDLFYLKKINEKNTNEGNIDATIPPLVYGQVKSKSHPDSRTLLFYNHYDVQPEDPLELWEEDPFGATIKGNHIIGRGASDDKGELITRIKAVEYYLRNFGEVPCNIKFIVEGEEEVGSPHLLHYLKQYKEILDCDAVVWEFGYIDEKDRPIIALGMKGMLHLEFITKSGPSIDVHSSLAPIIDNPAWHLIYALNSLRDRTTGRIMVRDWYKDVKEFSATEIDLLEKEPFEGEEYKKEYGIASFMGDVKGTEITKALAGAPTCNIGGLTSGYVGEGSKSIIPSKAIAKVDMRLVPDMQPEIQFERLNKHFQEKGFSGLVEVKLTSSLPAARTSADNPFVKIVHDAPEQTYGTSVTSISSAATGPMSYFIKVFGAPCVCVGSTYKFGNIHAPNEFARIDLLDKTTNWITKIIDQFQ